MPSVSDDRSVFVPGQLQSEAVSETSPPVTNRGCSKRISVSGGEDWVDLSTFGAWQDGEDGDVPENLRSEWAECVRLGQIDGQKVPWRSPEGHALLVEPRGFAMRGNKTLVRLTSSYGNLVVWDPRSRSKAWGQTWIEVPGTACLQHGAAECVQFWRDVARSLGYSESRNILRRVDWCFDLPWVSVENFYSKMLGKSYSCRGKPNQHGYLETGWTGTLGDPKSIMVKFYDKFRESAIKERREPGYVRMMTEKRWRLTETEARPGEVFEATRVEAMMRKDWLRNGTKKFSIQTWESWLDHRPKVLDHVFGSWCVFRDQPPDRKNRHYDGEVMAEWKTIRDAIGPLCVSGSERDAPLRMPSVPASAEQAAKVAYSYAVTAFVASYGGDPAELDYIRLRRSLWELLMRQHHDRDDNGSELERIRSLIECRRIRTGVVGDDSEVPF